MMTSYIGNAMKLAWIAHYGYFRKDGITPYVVHPIEVMRLLQKCGVTNQEILAVALLHDVIEDTSVTYEQLSAGDFKGYVADSVLALTIPSGVTKQQYIDSFAGKPMDLVKVKAADRICNVKDFIASGDRVYARKYFMKGQLIFRGLLQDKQPCCVVDALLKEYQDLADDFGIPSYVDSSLSK